MTEVENGNGSRRGRQADRQRAITEAVMAQGAIRIEQLAEQFGISVMTVHRDLEQLEGRGLLRKDRGVATATSTSFVESSDVYRTSREQAEKEALALAALEVIEPGESLILDDSTTVLHLARHLPTKAPLTVITNVLTVMNELGNVRGLTLLALGGQYYNWCSAFMGRTTTQTLGQLHADTFIMSTSAIVNDVAFHQTLETVDVKRAMFEAADRRILLADHTKFDKRALHALLPLADFDLVLLDAATAPEHLRRLRKAGVNVQVVPKHGHGRDSTTRPQQIDGQPVSRSAAGRMN